MSAESDGDARTAAMIQALQKRMDRAAAEVVKLHAMVKALGGRVHTLEVARDALEDGPAQAVALTHDPNMPSQAERDAIRKRLRAATLAGIKANRTDRYRAGRTYRQESSE